MSGPEIVTLGCRLNIAESEAMRVTLAGADDLVIVNSCAVTEEAVRQTRRAIRRARRERPAARIVVTGCAAEIEREAFAAMPEVSAVVPNARKLDSVAYPNTVRAEHVEGLPSSPSDSEEERGGFRQAQAERYLGQVSGEPTHARAFLPVQNGCDHRCTFCIIPYGRGPSRSEPAGAVIERVRALIAGGCQEVVLTGVDVTSYGDLPGDSLGLLVERILRLVPDLPRLRLSSLDPVEIDDRLLALIMGEPRLMPHLHLSLQAGDDLILKRMKRRHLRADAIRLVERVKAARSEVAIGADLIAGFPTETEAMFANSLALAEDCDIVFGHIFPYSPRRGTPAARMPQLEREVIRARARRLREACEARQARWLDSLVGTTQCVLIELDGRTGHAENFAKVKLKSPSPPGEGLGRGSVQRIQVTARRGDTLIGMPA